MLPALAGHAASTLAAAVATEQASLAGDRACGEALTRIARDEAEHSLLAWRFLRYAVERGGAPIAERLRAELSQLPTELAPPLTVVPAEVWNYYGRLTAEQQADVVARAWRDVIRPAMALLCGEAVSVYYDA